MGGRARGSCHISAIAAQCHYLAEFKLSIHVNTGAFGGVCRRLALLRSLQALQRIVARLDTDREVPAARPMPMRESRCVIQA